MYCKSYFCTWMSLLSSLTDGHSFFCYISIYILLLLLILHLYVSAELFDNVSYGLNVVLQ